MKILGLDIGERWVGVALGNAETGFVFPESAISFSELFKYLENGFRKGLFNKVVYGIPFTLKGELGSQAKKVEEVVSSFKSNLVGLEWIGVDERFSSKAAIGILHQQGHSLKGNKLREQSISAAVILQTYLNSKAV